MNTESSTPSQARRVVWIALALLLASFLAGGAWYLFRTKQFDSGVYLVQADHRFGKVWRLRLDGNYDGEPDVVALVSPNEYGISVDELWQDHDFDGDFDRYFSPGPGVEFTAKIDDNGDGQFDRELNGQAAVTLYPLMWGPLANEQLPPGNP